MTQHQHGSDYMSPQPVPPIRVSSEVSPKPAPQNHTRLFLYEAAFVACFNMLNSWFVAWLVYHRKPIIPVWGMSGVVFNSFPSSFVPAFLITICGTLALRQRLASSGRHDPVSPSRWPAIARLPAVLWQRALVIAIASGIVTVLITILCVMIAKPVSLDFGRFMDTQMVQAGILGLIVGPLVGARALLDPVRRRPDPSTG